MCGVCKSVCVHNLSGHATLLVGDDQHLFVSVRRKYVSTSSVVLLLVLCRLLLCYLFREVVATVRKRRRETERARERERERGRM